MAKAGLHAETILGGGLPFYRGITRVAIIDDRTPLDAAVYVAANGDREGAERLFDEANAWIGLEYYDHFYVLDPTGVPYVNDAERTETFEERQQIHETLLGFFAEHGIAYTLLTGTEQERIDQVVGAIQGSWASMAPPVSEPLTQFSLTSGPLEAVLWTRAG